MKYTYFGYYISSFDNFFIPHYSMCGGDFPAENDADAVRAFYDHFYELPLKYRPVKGLKIKNPAGKVVHTRWQ